MFGGVEVVLADEAPPPSTQKLPQSIVAGENRCFCACYDKACRDPSIAEVLARFFAALVFPSQGRRFYVFGWLSREEAVPEKKGVKKERKRLLLIMAIPGIFYSITGDHSKWDQILRVTICKYIGSCV